MIITECNYRVIPTSKKIFTNILGWSLVFFFVTHIGILKVTDDGKQYQMMQ